MKGRTIPAPLWHARTSHPGAFVFPGNSPDSRIASSLPPQQPPAVFSPESHSDDDFVDNSGTSTKKQLARTPAASHRIPPRPMHLAGPHHSQDPSGANSRAPPSPQTHVVADGLQAMTAFSLDFFPAFGILLATFCTDLSRSGRAECSRFGSSPAPTHSVVTDAMLWRPIPFTLGASRRYRLSAPVSSSQSPASRIHSTRSAALRSSK